LGTKDNSKFNMFLAGLSISEQEVKTVKLREGNDKINYDKSFHSEGVEAKCFDVDYSIK